MSLGRALAAEIVKYRRSTILAVTIAVPVIVTLAWLVSLRVLPAGIVCGRYVYPFLRAPWAVLFLPLTVQAMAAISCELERASGGWRALLAQPVSRASLYAAKLIVLEALVLLSAMVFSAGTWLAGLVVELPDSAPPGRLLAISSTGAVTAGPILALQLWLSTRLRSLFWPIAIVSTGTVGLLTLAIIEERRPWSMAVDVLAENRPGPRVLAYVGAAMLAVLFAAIGMRDFARKDME